jgi:manganese transport protein
MTVLADPPQIADVTPRATTTCVVPRAPHRPRRLAPLLGPAFVAAIAYVDPGNFATNFSAGASLGYRLVWVVVAANVIAMLIQSLAAKVGLATGSDLPQLCRRHFPAWVTRGLWLQAEVVVVATDVAEVLGGAVALNLLVGLPLPQGGLVTGLVAYGLGALRVRGYRPFQRVVIGLFAVIAGGFLLALLRTAPSPSAAATGLVPHLGGHEGLLLATGILGATVMPHAVYLHSALHRVGAPHAGPAERRTSLRRQRVDILCALGLAGLVNVSMLLVAASALHGDTGADPVSTTLESLHARLGTSLGSPVALLFAVTLLASGFASSGVGTFAGEVVMAGFLRRRIPAALRRLASLAPAVLLLCLGVEPTAALVGSQVVLSFGIPFALVPLLLLTRRVDVMGDLVNRRGTTVAAAVCAGCLIALNAYLLLDAVGVV